MKLADLDKVEEIAQRRAFLQHQLGGLGSGLTVAIDGVRLDDAMVCLVRPHIATEIRAKIHAFNTQLGDIGVDVC